MTEGRTAPRVVDFSTHLSGPLASHLLAETGAEVIKVESPRGGDGLRSLRPLIEGVGMMHVALNGGARSIAVSTRSEAWRPVVEAAARWADVVIVGSRPKDAAKRGLDFASLRAVNDSLVYCQLSGFGERGPWRDNTAHGQTMDGFAGAVPTEWNGDFPTTPAGYRTAGTTLAGVFAALGAMAGLYRRDHSGGTAQHVNVSIWGTAFWWQWRDVTNLANLDERWSDYRDLGTRYRMYGTADHRGMLVCPIEKKFWERFCDLAEMPEGAREHGTWESTHTDFGSGPEYAEEMEQIAERMRQKTMDEWIELFGKAEIPFAPTLSLEEVMASEHAEVEEAMRTYQLDGKEVEAPASPLRIRSDAEPGASELESILPPPALGAHNDEVLAELGLAEWQGKL
jgi:crotonobetainyl-CoA:carnitine CoA-transferase CaiB-like acyl-CoA transferase